MSFLLDTNVISELRKPAKRRDDRFNAWAGALAPSDTFLSVITVLELRAGIESGPLVLAGSNGRSDTSIGLCQ
ncbi:hypothetical protein [Frankia sp. Cr1]|uniref:hypothetical protein n=1 Tax=Frankia sp. Cr1 TaxID=3073931 RepID=UPI002AD44061|nr:hypothetical protein [Frankia sp. Cr1]